MHESALRSTATGGGKIARHWQASSLFGLETFGEPQQIDRRHGYGAGRIEFDTDGLTIRHWPRQAIRDENGWRFAPDHKSCVLVEGDCTQPERLDNWINNPKSVKGSEGLRANPHVRHIQEME